MFKHNAPPPGSPSGSPKSQQSCPRLLPRGYSIVALLALLLAGLWGTYARKWQLLRQMSKSVVQRYGDGKDRISLDQLQLYTKTHGYDLNRVRLAKLFAAHDINTDKGLTYREVRSLLTSEAFISEIDDVEEEEVSPKEFRNWNSDHRLELALIVAVSALGMFLGRERIGLLQTVLECDGWLRFAAVVRANAVRFNWRILGDDASSGFMAEIFADTEATRVFKIERRVGEGSQADVWECREVVEGGNGEAYAVKRFRVEQKSAKEKLREIKNEVLPAIKDLQHPNIVKYENLCLEVGRADGMSEILILMEFLHGCSLEDLVYSRWSCSGIQGYEKSLREFQAQRVMLPVASALEYLHAHDILHLDLSPGNVRINVASSRMRGDLPHKLQVKLVDFGCALDLRSEDKYEPVQNRNRTFFAPEMVEKVSKQTDVWLFGELLYYCLLGAAPFGSWPAASETEQGIADFMDRLNQGKFLHPDKPAFRCWSHLSPEAMEIIETCLRPDPDQRLSFGTTAFDNHVWWNAADPASPKTATRKIRLPF